MAEDSKKSNKNGSAKAYSGTVIRKGGFTFGTKDPKKYDEGSKFETDSESLYQDLINQKYIKK